MSEIIATYEETGVERDCLWEEEIPSGIRGDDCAARVFATF